MGSLRRQSFIKRSLLSLLLSSSLWIISGGSAYSATKFVCVYNKIGEDYSTIQNWETAVDDVVNLTLTTVKVFSISSKTGVVADLAAVTGATSGCTATVVHVDNATTQILVRAITGTCQSGEQLRVDASNYVVLSDAGDSAILTLRIYDDDGVMDEVFTIDGVTTSATNYWEITVPVGERHNGTAATGARIVQSASAASRFAVEDPHAIIEWLNIDLGTNNIGFLLGFGATGSVTFRNNILHDWGGNPGLPHGFEPSAGTNYIYNNIFYNMGGSFEGCSYIAGGTNNFYNNTCHNSDYAFKVGAGTVNAYNNAASTPCSGCTAGQYVGNFAAGGYNSSADATADDDAEIATGAQISVNYSGYFVSTTAGSEDLHLTSSATALIDNGDGTTPSGQFTTDIDLDSRPGVALDWDIGADEFISTSVPTTLYDATIYDGTLY